MLVAENKVRESFLIQGPQVFPGSFFCYMDTKNKIISDLNKNIGKCICPEAGEYIYIGGLATDKGMEVIYEKEKLEKNFFNDAFAAHAGRSYGGLRQQ